MSFLPPNIDLTEHRDFGHNSTFIGDMDTLIDIPLGEFQTMSLDQYEYLKWREGLFGKKRHYTESIEVFGGNEDTFAQRIQKRCYRCGKDHRVPWNIMQGLCRKCFSEVDEDRKGRIPWRHIPQESFGSVKYNLFNSR